MKPLIFFSSSTPARTASNFSFNVTPTHVLLPEDLFAGKYCGQRPGQDEVQGQWVCQG